MGCSDELALLAVLAVLTVFCALSVLFVLAVFAMLVVLAVLSVLSVLAVMAFINYLIDCPSLEQGRISHNCRISNFNHNNKQTITDYTIHFLAILKDGQRPNCHLL